MYIEHPADENAYRYPGQFFFGDLLLGAPVTTAGTGESQTAGQKVWLPEGDNWYHSFTGEQYKGGQEIIVQSPLDQFPLFVKGGYPLPMQPYTDRMCATPLTELIVRCYPGEEECDHSYTLYEDDGLTEDYLKGHSSTTRLSYRKDRQGGVFITVHPTENSYEGQPLYRSYRIELPGVSSNARISVNGKRVKYRFDRELNGPVVSVQSTDIRKAVEVKVL
jgi:alpha-glucosidase (family GH31 glycosyl hydrolase)